MRSISSGLLESRCGCVSCTSCFEDSAHVVHVSLQPAIPTWHQPGPPQTLRPPLQVQLWLQWQTPPLRTSPPSSTTQSHVGELCNPGLSRWESFQLLVLESCGWGIIHLKCLLNWMRILHLVSFFLLNQRNAQSRQWLYQRLSDKYQEHPDHSGVLGRLTGLFWMSTPNDCVNRESEFALWCIQILIHWGAF